MPYVRCRNHNNSRYGNKVFRRKFRNARSLLCSPAYIPDMLSKSRFSRRLRRIRDLFFRIFVFFSEIWKNLSTDSVYLTDSFPVPVCDNIRIPRAKIYKNEAYRGYIPVKKRYFYGLKVHMMCTGDGKPAEIFFTPGSENDTGSLRLYTFNIPEGSIVYGDKAYNVYEIGDLLRETAGIHLMPVRKRNSRRKFPPFTEYLQRKGRKMIGTANSLITGMFPKKYMLSLQKALNLKSCCLFLPTISDLLCR